MIYIALLLFLLVMHFGKKDNSRKRKFVFIIVVLIACCGYMCGSDWRGYELQWDNLIEHFARVETGAFEPGIYALMYVFKSFGFSYWDFSCILKAFCLVPIWISISKFTEKSYFYMAVLFYFSFYGYELFVDCPFRNLCAIAICSISVINYKKSYLFHFLVIIIAFLFHATALVMIPFLFIMKRDIKAKYYAIVYAAVFILSIKGGLLDQIAKIPLLDAMFIGEKIDRYAINGYAEDSLISNPFSLSEILRTILCIWLLLNKKYFTKTEDQIVLFNGAMAFFIFAKFGAAVELFSRFSFYFAAFYAIAIIHLAIKNCLNIKPLSYTLLTSLLSIVICISAITADYRFIPYTNYIYYKMFVDPLPLYNVRDNYNFQNSPYSYKNR